MQTSTQVSIPLVYKPQRNTQIVIRRAPGEKPLAVLMGQIGVGKTTLLNLICGTNREAGAARDSMTRHLFLSSTNSGASFELFDTPGVNSRIKTYDHIFLLKEALTARPVNTIFIVLKYDSRFDNILDNLLKVQEAVYNYESKIVVMISHWEQSRNPEQESQEIGQLLEDFCVGIVFYSERNDANQVSNCMFEFLNTMEKTALKIENEEFFLNFNVYEIKTEMKRSYMDFTKEMQKINKAFDELIKNTKNILPKDEFDDFLGKNQSDIGKNSTCSTKSYILFDIVELKYDIVK